MKKESSIFGSPIVRPYSLNPIWGLQSLLPQALHLAAYVKGLDWHKEVSIPKKEGEWFWEKGCFKKGHFSESHYYVMGNKHKACVMHKLSHEKLNNNLKLISKLSISNNHKLSEWHQKYKFIF